MCSFIRLGSSGVCLGAAGLSDGQHQARRSVQSFMLATPPCRSAASRGPSGSGPWSPCVVGVCQSMHFVVTSFALVIVSSYYSKPVQFFFGTTNFQAPFSAKAKSTLATLALVIDLGQATPSPSYCRCYHCCRLVSPREGVTGRSVVTVVILARGGCSGEPRTHYPVVSSPLNSCRRSPSTCLSKLAVSLVGTQILNIPDRQQRFLCRCCRPQEGTVK